MAILSTQDMAVGRRDDGRIVLRIDEAGESRVIVMEADAAQVVGTALANAGLDAGGVDGRFQRISGVRVLAHRESDDLAIEMIFEHVGGPVVARIDPDVLMQMWRAAGDALGLR